MICLLPLTCTLLGQISITSNIHGVLSNFDYCMYVDNQMEYPVGNSFQIIHDACLRSSTIKNTVMASVENYIEHPNNCFHFLGMELFYRLSGLQFHVYAMWLRQVKLTRASVRELWIMANTEEKILLARILPEYYSDYKLLGKRELPYCTSREYHEIMDNLQ